MSKRLNSNSMPLEFAENISGIRCGVWRLEEPDDTLARMLCDDKAAGRIKAEVRSAKRRRERLASLLLLRRLVGKPLFIGHDDEGCPRIEEGRLHLSVSHSPEYAAVCVAQFPVGIDIETVSDRQLSVAEKFLSPCEAAILQHGGNPPRETAALLWSVKEAVYKLASDTRIHLGSDIRVSDFALSPAGELRAGIISSGTSRSVIAEYRFFSDTVLVISRYGGE